MPKCKQCGEEVDEVIPVRVENRTKKLCEDCVEDLEAQGAIDEAALEAMRNLMEYKGG